MKQQKNTALRNLCKAACFVLVFFLMAAVCNYALYDDTGTNSRLTLHELFESEKNVDVLFLGPSLSYSGLNPEILDESFHANTFNGSTAYQTMEGTYAILVEAAERYDLKAVYVEINHRATEENVQQVDTLYKYIIYDYLPRSANRLQYLVNSSNVENWLTMLFPARRNNMSPTQIFHNFQKKASEDYRNFAYISNEKQTYGGKGFIRGETQSPQGSFMVLENRLTPISEDHIAESNVEYIRKIIDFCKEKDIELVFYCAPMSNFEIVAAGNYDDYIAQARALLEPQGVPFVDFNLLRQDNLPDDDSLYQDSRHLNVYGAEIFSRLFGDYFTGRVGDEIFYSSWAEKYAALNPRAYGVGYSFVTDFDEVAEHGEDPTNRWLLCLRTIASSGDVQLQLTAKPENGEAYALAPCGDGVYAIPKNQHGVIEIALVEGANTSSAEVPY